MVPQLTEIRNKIRVEGRGVEGKVLIPRHSTLDTLSLLRRVLCPNHDRQDSGPVRVFVVFNQN
jgi:hypothetical protein